MDPGRDLPPEILFIDRRNASRLEDADFAAGTVLNIDKPTGRTSFWVVRRVRRLAGVRKVGHAGTLDPLATGVLLVLTGRATKFQDRLMASRKRYLAELLLGAVSDTLDRSGEVRVLQGGACPFDDARLEEALAAHTGEIEQVPPMYSALRVNGERLYRRARRGEEVARVPRRVRIDGIEVLGFEWPRLLLDVRCGKGTYIRSLADDLGRMLGCGALLQELRRTASGSFCVENALPLERLENPANEAGGAVEPRAEGSADAGPGEE